MKPKKIKQTAQVDLFKSELVNFIDHRNELFQLAHLIDWSVFEKEFGELHADNAGHPPIPTRIMVGLHYLKHAFGLSDEQVVMQWVENPYWQYFCGMQFFQHEFPIHPTSMTRFRQRIGEAGCELMLAETVNAGLQSKTIKRSSLDSVTVDTTVMENNVAFPTDSSLLNKAREKLVALAKTHGLKLRQSYQRVCKHLALKASRYFHAKQFRRGQKAVKKIRVRLGRVIRDVERKLTNQTELEPVFDELLYRARTLFYQKKHDKNKLYSLHEPDTVCISKGKAHKRYEFGSKVSLAVTNKDNFVVSCRALDGNPYDGHTLTSTITNVRKITGVRPQRCFVDRGYKGHKVHEYFSRIKVYISGQRQGVSTKALKAELKRRSAIEPVIGLMKSDGLLQRSYLKGMIGNKLNALLCGAGHNIRLILKKLRLLFAWILYWLLKSRNELKSVPA